MENETGAILTVSQSTFTGDLAQGGTGGGNARRALRHSPGNGRRPATVLEERADRRQTLDAAQAHAKVARRHQPVMLSAAVASLAALTLLAGSIGWIMRDRAARRAKLTAYLQSAVEELQRLPKGGKWPQSAGSRRAR